MHKSVRRSFGFALAIIAVGLSLEAQLPAADRPPSPSLMSVRVLLRDERDFTAYVDSRTDDEVLWLRFTRGSATLSTGFTWDLVRSVQAGALKYTAAEFRDMATFFASNQPINSGQVASRNIRFKEAESNSPSNPIDRARTKVQSLSITASVANWDRDAEFDGIEVRLLARNAYGEIIPVRGSISAELFGRSFAPVRESPPVLTLGRWSQAVPMPGQSMLNGATCRLPFLSQNPDYNQELQSIGLLRVQLNVANQGDFFAESWVRIRSYNPIRDALLHHSEHHDSFGRYRARHW